MFRFFYSCDTKKTTNPIMADEVAEFSNNRQQKLSESYKKANVNARLVPAMSNAVQKEMEEMEEDEENEQQETQHVEAGAPTAESKEKSEQLSRLAFDTFQQIRGNISLTRSETKQIAVILQPNNPLVTCPVRSVLVLAVLSALLGVFLSAAMRRH